MIAYVFKFYCSNLWHICGLEIKDKWGAEKEPVKTGVNFYLEYLGSTLVEELEEGLSYGNKICSKAVKIIMDMVSRRTRFYASFDTLNIGNNRKYS